MACDRRKYTVPTVAAGPERPPSPARTPATPAQRLEPRVRGRFSGPPWRRVLSAVAVVALLVCGAFGFVVAYAAFTLPSIDNLGAATGSLRILDRHGALIADVGFGATPHDTVTLDQVSPAMRVAILAAEDRQFYTEGAINPGRILKALVVDVILRRPRQRSHAAAGRADRGSAAGAVGQRPVRQSAGRVCTDALRARRHGDDGRDHSRHRSGHRSAHLR